MCLKSLKSWWHSDDEMYQLKNKYPVPSDVREITMLTPITKLTIPAGCSVTLEGGEITIKIEGK